LARIIPGLVAALMLACLLAACGGDPSDRTVVAQRLVSVTITDPFDGPGARRLATADTLSLWLGPDLARRDSRDGSLLVDLERQVLTMVDHGDRSYVSGTTAEVYAELAALAGDTTRSRDRKTRQLKSLLDVDARVVDTGEDDVIDGYQCRRWVVEQRFGTQQTTSEVWLTTDLDVDFTLLHRATQPALAALPGGEAALAELSRLQGVPVWSTAVMQIMGRQTRTETRLVQAVLDTVPLSFFRPPADYVDQAPRAR
jgi:hypothetical protein